VIATTMIGMCEALLYGQRAGLDLETMLGAIRGGAAGCWSLDHYAPRILRRDFDPGFFVEHFVKDMGLALAEAERMQLALPGLALAQQLYCRFQKGRSTFGKIGNLRDGSNLYIWSSTC
jgi:3-hydroxyisobutyrate dehydrogenase